MSTSVAYNRPGTPFPFSSSSPSSSSSRRMSQPLHFTVPALPIRTPPSLLKRSGSSSSTSGSASGSSLPRTPEHTSSRRLSDSSDASSSSSSSPIISTPVLYRTPSRALDLDDDVEILLDMSEAVSTIAPPSTSTSTSTFESSKAAATPARPPLVRGHAVPLPPASTAHHDAHRPTKQTKQPKLTRPKFVRRDTPRPASNALGMSQMTSLSVEPRRQGSFTSAIDGGKWVVVQ